MTQDQDKQAQQPEQPADEGSEKSAEAAERRPNSEPLRQPNDESETVSLLDLMREIGEPSPHDDESDQAQDRDASETPSATPTPAPLVVVCGDVLAGLSHVKKSHLLISSLLSREVPQDNT